MKLNSIKISNVLNFKEYENFDECPEIKFNAGVNLIIGPNGVGKSNLLEIINRIFNNGLLYPASFQEGAIKAKLNGKNSDTTRCLNVAIQELRLLKNHNGTSQNRKISLDIGLSEKDYPNIKFILDNKSEIISIISRYSQLRPTIVNVTEDELKSTKSIKLVFKCTAENDVFTLVSEHNSDIEKIILTYLQFFNFFQYIILIGISYENKSWNFLSNTYSMIPSNRNYSQIESNFQISQNEQDLIQSIRTGMAHSSLISVNDKEPAIFTYIRAKFCFGLHKLVAEKGMAEYPDSEKFLDELFVDLNTELKKILGFEVYIKKQDPNTNDYSFMIRYSKNRQTVPIGELSAGEKGLIHFIFSIFGYGLENGVMVIDEPELHLHPQMQEKCLELLRFMSKDYSMQFIVVTHSPLLVNYEIIEGVQRFYKENGQTQIISPEFNIHVQDLVRYLNYTRATNVLFGTHVVLTEGDSDAYFYKFLYDKFKEKNDELVDLEFMDMGGVDYRKPWKKFFDSWKIKWFLIRDKDKLELTDIQIETKYTEGEFILKQGDLESYIGSEFQKKLANAVKFCATNYESNTSDFETWFKDEENKVKIDELKTIFTKISETVKTL